MAGSTDVSVLYVNDDPELLRLVARRLEREDDRIVVRTAESVDAAEEVRSRHGVDCIVSDHHMPGRTGLEYLRSVRENDDGIPFLLFTETGDEEVASEAISVGVTDYVIHRAIGDPSPLLAQKIRSAVEHERTQRRMDRTARQLRSVAEATNDALWIFSADWGELHFINSAYESVFGQPAAELRAEPQSFLDRVHDEDVDRVERAMARASNGEHVRIEYRVNKSAELQSWVESRCTPVVDDGGETEFISGFSREITDRKYYEASLVEKNEQLERFASTVAHDLRNPLNVADGNVDLAREDDDSPYLETSARALAQMDDLIDDLLTLAKQGTAIDDRSPVGFESLVRSSIEDLLLPEATLEIVGSGTLRCDPDRTAEAFGNLFRNALDHGGESVTVTVGVLEAGNGFYVEDDGPGIAPSERETVFERGHTTSEHGSGLGLAIVDRIVTAHGWEIEIAEGTDGGARFEVIGPDLDPTEAADPKPAGPGA
ncbi:PAS domain S-box-containing protein [Halorubrum aquaticum]|uniref:histidine kinase n=1 Tax=Halorubrum aquaticum TaxID=387340 RepID=A0A1I3ABH2_9EURY|nr:ATP-binding protein [Halorubrum aquaticum]SFH47463.1 PAS domain S-box-containing protein [Halorubrum aquaticum]